MDKVTNGDFNCASLPVIATVARLPLPLGLFAGQRSKPAQDGRVTANLGPTVAARIRKRERGADDGVGATGMLQTASRTDLRLTPPQRRA